MLLIAFRDDMWNMGYNSKKSVALRIQDAIYFYFINCVPFSILQIIDVLSNTAINVVERIKNKKKMNKENMHVNDE